MWGKGREEHGKIFLREIFPYGHYLNNKLCHELPCGTIRNQFPPPMKHARRTAGRAPFSYGLAGALGGIARPMALNARCLEESYADGAAARQTAP